MKKRLVVVTGATGFVGRHLCPELLKAGYRVRATYIENSPPKGWADAIDWVKSAEIGSHTDWSRALQGGVSYVVHLAAVAHRVTAKDQVAEAVYDEVNHLGTAQLARAIAQTPSVRRLFFMSSIGAVASLADSRVDEQTPCRPDTAYGRSKLAAERAIQEILASTSVDWCIFRPPLLYGSGNPGNMGRLLQLIDLRLPLPLASVRNRRTFLYIGNLVDAILVALEHPAVGRKVFCISDGQELSTPELIRGVGKASGKTVRLFPFPTSGLRLLGKAGGLLKTVTGCSVGIDVQTVEKLCGSLSVDGSHFRATCGWNPPFSVEQGLRATVGRA